MLFEKGEEWTAEYIRWCKSPTAQEPRRYAHRDIRSALELETNSKCAYCEGRINDVAYNHIEHKLPKRKHPYLVCDWANLTIACPRCNTKKSDYDAPECPLLDPYIDDVERAIVFFGPLALARGSARAQATITLLDLNRKDLLHTRAEAIVRLDRLLDLAERAASELDLLHALWLDIEVMTNSKGEFASACRHFLAAQVAERGLTKP